MMAMRTLSPYAYHHNQELLASLEPGDLLEFPRGLYSHWAIYVGDEEVVHLAGDDNDSINGQSNVTHCFSIAGQRFDKARVKVENFWNVVEGSKAKRNNAKDQKHRPLPKRDIVKNAWRKIGRVGYNILFDNCEHFASWCRYGLSKSEQVDDALTGVAVAGAMVGAIGLTAALLYGASRLFSSDEEEDPEEL